MKKNERAMSKSPQEYHLNTSSSIAPRERTSEKETTPIYQNASLEACISPSQQNLPIHHQRPLFENSKSSYALMKRNNITMFHYWALTQIQPFPNSSPMSRTCFEVNGEEVNVIAGRISNSNRLRSIETKYDSSRPIANCVASRNTKFQVWLHFQNNETASSLSSETNNKVILVQVQRRSGCCLIFHEEYKAILQAAKHGTVVAHDEESVAGTIRGKTLPDTLPDIPLEDGVLEDCLEKAQIQLLSDRYDEQLLSLEDVACTTNPQASSEDVSQKASKLITRNGEFSGIRESISSIILQNKDDKDDDAFKDSIYIRCLALTILANVMSGLSKQNLLANFIRDDQWSILSFIPSLMQDIKSSVDHQCNASLSTKCLSILFKDSPEARLQACEDNALLPALENAKSVGKLSYARLEKGAQSAINEIMVTEQSIYSKS